MVIAAPAGCGKTTLAAKYSDKVKDLESSAYQYCLDGMTREQIEAAKHTKRTLNPEFPLNYIKAIREADKKYPIVCVWCHHDKIFPVYREQGIPFIIFYPSHEAISEYYDRFIGRGNTKDFADWIMHNYHEYIDIWEKLPEPHEIMQKGEYLEDTLRRLGYL